MYVVSGAPRSGTSLMMAMFRAALGEDRGLGKSLVEDEQEPTKGAGEDAGTFRFRSYLHGKGKAKRAAKLAERRDMNPNGFWENEWSVQGIRYMPSRHEDLANAKVAPLKFTKVVSDGLMMSDPRYVSKVVYMLRDPQEVAKSQEKLKRRMLSDDMAAEVDGKQVKVTSCSSYVRSCMCASKWFGLNPDVPVLVVKHSDLMQHPAKVCADLSTFIGEGAWDAAECLVDRKLYRSGGPRKVDHALVDMAYKMHDEIEAGRWGGVMEAKADPELMPKGPSPVMCTRLKRITQPEECAECLKCGTTTKHFIEHAQRIKIDWASEPCLHQVRFNGVTVEDSIANNHWLEAVE